jgi:hypothetical protein
MHLFRIIRFPRFFRIPPVVKHPPFCCGVKSNSQPTTCGHTACSLCVGWRVAAAPSNPAKTQRRVTP